MMKSNHLINYIYHLVFGFANLAAKESDGKHTEKTHCRRDVPYSRIMAA